jgi:hypothetical protein
MDSLFETVLAKALHEAMGSDCQFADKCQFYKTFLHVLRESGVVKMVEAAQAHVKAEWNAPLNQFGVKERSEAWINLKAAAKQLNVWLAGHK